MDQASLVAIGGLNREPFAGRPDVGRIRRVYVRPAWRNRGIGNKLIQTLVRDARSSFGSLHLRTENPAAAALCERIGFSRFLISDATHILMFDRANYSLDWPGGR